MFPEPSAKFQGVALSAARVFIGAGYFSHGAAKLFGWFGGMGGPGHTVNLMSRFGAAGIIEVTCGTMIILGLFTRQFAFIASGEMAVAYFWMHVGGSGSPWWWVNHGELVMVFSFVWLLFAAYGAGPYPLDAWMARRRSSS
jgi:putative oxidoreductase